MVSVALHWLISGWFYSSNAAIEARMWLISYTFGRRNVVRPYIVGRSVNDCSVQLVFYLTIFCSIWLITCKAYLLGGVTFAQKMCRNCECRGRDMRAVFLNYSCILRSDDVHKDRCMMLKGYLCAKTRQYWCKVLGMNDTSPLQSLDF